MRMRAHVVYCFGAFQLDPVTLRVTSGGELVCLTAPQVAVLLLLVMNGPDVVEKEALGKAGWGAEISPNSIEQAISWLRRALNATDEQPFIETIRHRGYRFVEPVRQLERQDAAAGGSDVEAFRAFLHGSRELATLNLDGIRDARRAFEQCIERVPTDAAAHAALGMACALIYEASRVDPTRDLESLRCAVHYARLATTIDPVLADGWSTLGFAVYLDGDSEAAAICRKAVVLEPDGWRHWLRLSYVSWGDPRLESSNRALLLRPDLALAYWLKSTVLIARGATDSALIPIRLGCAAQDKQRFRTGPYPAVGLHLLYGLVLAALGRLEEALQEFACEMDVPDHGQLYARERAANTWYARGAVHLRRGEHDAAVAAFRQVLGIEPRHYCAMAALGLPIPAVPASGGRHVMDAAIAQAVLLARQGRHPAAAEAFGSGLQASPASHAGWILPVEPILHVSARPDLWAAALAIIRERAS
jgi:DNA-binding winged helix-turn-helix (wHTH) protein